MKRFTIKLFIAVFFLVLYLNLQSQNFITTWDLATAGSGATQIQFNATIATGGTTYSWLEISPGSSTGSGTLSAGTSLRTISGLPSGAIIRLEIAPTNLQRFYINNGTDRNRLTTINQWGTANWTDMQLAFYGCSNLQVTATDIPILTGVTNMTSMFRGCTNLNGPSNINSWNVSTITNMNFMFGTATMFNQPLHSWNTSSVINMGTMFNGASAFNQPLSSWNTSSVTSMASMFGNASSFNQSISSWNVSNVLNMASMLNGASSFNQDLGSWILNSAVGMTNMLNSTAMDCNNYSSTLIGWQTNNPTVTGRSLGATGLTYANYAISSRNSLTTTQSWTITDAGTAGICGAFETRWNLTIGGSGATQIQFNATVATGGATYYWETVPSGTSGSGTLTPGTSLRTISGLPAGAIIKLQIAPQNLQRFYINNGLDKNRLSDVTQWGTANWTSMQYAFYGCNNLQITATDIPVLTSVSNMSNMFRDCFILNGPSNINSWNTASVTDMSYLFTNASIFNQAISSWNTTNVVNMTSMFEADTVFNQSLSGWNTGNVTNMSHMFRLAKLFNQPLLSWNTSLVTNMSYMFNHASAFNQNIATWNTSNVTNMSSMFNTATSFNQNINGWNTSNVVNFAFMFQNASAFNLPLNIWNISSATNISGMFYNASAFNQNINSWNTSNVTNMSFLFYNATSYNQNHTNWALNNIVDVTNMFTNSALDCNNYSSTLISWYVNFPLLSGRNLGAGGVYYANYATTARNNLVTSRGWTITDAGNIGSCSGEFETSWNLSTSGSGTTQIQFSASVASGAAGYYWETIPSGTSGSGIFTAGTSLRTITGIPNGSTIKLLIGPINLQRFFIDNGADKNRLTDVTQWGTATWTNMANAFRGCSNLQITSTDIPKLSGVSNLSRMFENCKSLNGPTNISGWITNTVTDLSYMFSGDSLFNKSLNTWNTSNVTNMREMFYSCINYNQPMNNWNTANVTNMKAMFYNAKKFNQSINSWNVSNVSDFSFFLGMNDSFNQPLYSWNTSNAIHMSQMFAEAISFNQNLGSWHLNNSVDMTYMLHLSGLNCDNYSETLIGWQTNNPTVTGRTLGATGLAYSNYALASRNILTTTRSWTITDAGAVGSCGSFETRWNMTITGSGATQIQFRATIATGGATYYWETVPSGTSGSGTLSSGTLITHTITGIPAGAIIKLQIAPKNLQQFYMFFILDENRLTDVTQWGTANWTDMGSAFRGCTNLQVTATDIPNLSGVTNLSYMFSDCKVLNGPANISTWLTSNIIYMNDMFSGDSMFNQNINNWNTSNVTNMSRMFASCVAFNQPLNNWNTSNVLYMVNMFSNANTFNQPINSWNVSNVRYFDYFLSNAKSFNQSLHSWNTVNVLSMYSMFGGASLFNQDLGGWVLNPNVDMRFMINFTGIDCNNYSSTLIGWQTNNPTVTGRVLGAWGCNYNPIAVSARNTLTTTQSWTITGDVNLSASAYTVPINSSITALGNNTCNLDFVDPASPTHKIAAIDANGNTIDLSLVNITAKNNFVSSLPFGVTSVTSGTSGYYQIDNGTNTFRISRRMFTVQASGTYSVNGGVKVRFYFTSDDTGKIHQDAVPFGIIKSIGWYKSPLHNPQDIVNSMSASFPQLGSATDITPTYGIESGVYYAEFIVPNFSTFGFYAKTDNVYPLPVILTRFNATCTNQSIDINWNTATEINASHFILEYSTDATNWTYVNNILASGNSTIEKKYSINDIFRNELGYYRLVQVDNDGNTSIYGPILIQCNESKESFALYPNPAKTVVELNYSSIVDDENAMAEITDIQGNVIYQLHFQLNKGKNTILINTSQLTSGMYFVIIKNATKQRLINRLLIE